MARAKVAWPPPPPKAMAAGAAIPLLLPVAEKAGKAVIDIAQTPVLGWTRVTSYDKGRKHPKHIEERSSLNVRAWEIGVLALIGIGWWQVEDIKKRAAAGEWSLSGLFPGDDALSGLFRAIFMPWTP